MAAIALAESGGNPNAVNNDQNGTQDRGLWQINSIHGFSNSFDPNANAQQAVSVEHSQGLTAWSTYIYGQYKSHLQGDGTVPSPNQNASAASGSPGGNATLTEFVPGPAGGVAPSPEPDCHFSVLSICVDRTLGLMTMGVGLAWMVIALVIAI
jgi:hypothetical protein